MAYLPSHPDLNCLAGILMKYPHQDMLLFKLQEYLWSSFAPLDKNIRD